MLEIYMEKVKDLLNPTAGELKVRNNPTRGFYVENLKRNAVSSFATIEKLMDAGTKARTVASTAMNATSSRAHTIFQLILTQTKVDRAKGTATDKTALINLVDLAGSERADSTGATGDRLKEGSAINLSLSSLGNVISALAANSDPDKKHVRVPYRDSVLTMLLENSLGGNSKTIMIAAVSPADINYQETLSTLRYADRAKQIKTRAVVNEDPNEKMIRGLQSEIDALKKALAMGGGGGGESGLSGAALEEEKERVRAELRVELEARLNEEHDNAKSWEQKLAETTARQEQRDKELREQGIVSGVEREAQLEKAKSVPHVTNLNEDPQLNEQILYFLERGRDTTVGRRDAEPPNVVKLAGLGIVRDHAVMRVNGEELSVEPRTLGAKVYVNGAPITGVTILRHGARLVFGASHVYRVVVPAEAAAGTPPDGASPTDVLDYAYAVNEMNKGAMQAMAAEESKRDAELEVERHKADAKLAELESRFHAEKEAAAAAAEETRLAFEVQAAAMAGNEQRLVALREEQALQQQTATARQKELEAALQAQVEATRELQRKKAKDNQLRSLLDDKLLKTLPLVAEANAISDEMGKHVNFEPKLMTTGPKPKAAVVSGEDGDPVAVEDDIGVDIFVRVERADGSTVPVFWPREKFVNKLYSMREVYQTWVEHNHSLVDTPFAEGGNEADPWVERPEDTLVGHATVFLSALQYVLAISEAVPVINFAGVEQGAVHVRIVPHLTPTPPASALALTIEDGAGAHVPVDDFVEDLPENVEELRGKPLHVTVFVDALRGLPATLAAGLYVKFRFFLDEEARTGETLTRINSRLGFRRTFSPTVTDGLIRHLSESSLELEVWAKPALLVRAASEGGALHAATPRAVATPVAHPPAPTPVQAAPVAPSPVVVAAPAHMQPASVQVAAVPAPAPAHTAKVAPEVAQASTEPCCNIS